MSYDRYKKFRINGKVSIPPMIEIPVKPTDFYEEYRRGSSRLDLISYDYYGESEYDWLLLMANPSLGNMEYEIPDKSIIRIPYPLNLTIERLNSDIEKYNILYGTE